MSKKAGFHQLKQKDVKHVRETLWEKNERRCPILDIDLDPSDCALDHAHQDSERCETTEGQIRSTIHKFANSLEGSWRSKFVRSGASRYITFEECLLNMHEYLMEYREPMLHPSHAPGPRKLMKSSYRELEREIKKYNQYAKSPLKYPPYPKSGRCIKRLCELFQVVGLQPRYYGK